MLKAVKKAYEDGLINRFQFDTYQLFRGSDIGIHYLSVWNGTILRVLYEPLSLKSDQAMWIEGRRSILAEINTMIDCVERAIEGKYDVRNPRGTNTD